MRAKLKSLVASVDQGALAFLREAERLMDRGYVAAWFAWLEWIGVTSVIWAIGLRTESRILLAIAASCSFLLILVGVIASQRLQDEYIVQRAGVANASAVAAIATGFGTGATYVMTKTIMELLPSMGG